MGKQEMRRPGPLVHRDTFMTRPGKNSPCSSQVVDHSQADSLFV